MEDYIVEENKNVSVALNTVYGKLTGKFIYSVIIINEGDLAESDAKFYCGDTEDEVGDILEEEGYSNNEFLIAKCGIREPSCGVCGVDL